MSRFKRWYAAAVVVLMVGSFIYIKASALTVHTNAKEQPLSRTEIHNVQDLKSANPDFYRNVHEGDFEDVYADRVELVDGVTGEVIITRPKR